MVTTNTEIQKVEQAKRITDAQDKLFNTLFGVTGGQQGLLQQPLSVPEQKVVGFSPDQQAAFNLARTQGIGSYQPFLDAASQAQTAALGTTGAGVQTLGGAVYEPTAERLDQFRDPYQKLVTDEALKEIDRQAAMAQNQLAGKAVQSGAFGGSRFGLQQSELARNAQDLRSRRVFEDLSRNFQQAQAANQAANTQRMQAAQQFGNLGRQTADIAGGIASIGGATQKGISTDVATLSGIGGMQQQLGQQIEDANVANQLRQEQLPFERLAFGSNIVAQQAPFGGTQTQTISPLSQVNPYLQAASGIGSLGVGLGSLIKGFD
jgi:hypothetical protein